MARSFRSIGEFIQFMAGQAASLEAVQLHVLEQSAKLIQHQAQRAIGTYDYGWPQLAESTQAERARLGFPENEPLLRTGELERSIEHRVVSPWEAAVGSDHQVAVWQELGTTRIPARSFLAATAVLKEHQIVRHLGLAITAHLAGEDGFAIGAGPPTF